MIPLPTSTLTIWQTSSGEREVEIKWPVLEKVSETHLRLFGGIDLLLDVKRCVWMLAV